MSYQAPSQQQQTSAPSSSPAPAGPPVVRGKVVKVSKSVVAGTTEIAHQIHVKFEKKVSNASINNNAAGEGETRIITDNHKKVKDVAPPANSDGSQSLLGTWNGTMLQADLQEGDDIQLTLLSPTQGLWHKLDFNIAGISSVVDPSLLAKPSKKRKKNLTVDLLLSDRGLQRVYYKFPAIKWRQGPNTEMQNLHTLVMAYKEWSYDLVPNLHYQLFSSRCEKLGSQRRVKSYLEMLRYGKKPEECEFSGDMDELEREHFSQLHKSRKQLEEEEQRELDGSFIVNRALTQYADDDEAEYVDDIENQPPDDILDAHAAAMQPPSSTLKKQRPVLSDAEYAERERLRYEALMTDEPGVDPFADVDDAGENSSNNASQASQPSVAPRPQNAPRQSAAVTTLSLDAMLDDL